VGFPAAPGAISLPPIRLELAVAPTAFDAIGAQIDVVMPLTLGGGVDDVGYAVRRTTA
jgi:hypothetical protein